MTLQTTWTGRLLALFFAIILASCGPADTTRPDSETDDDRAVEATRVPIEQSEPNPEGVFDIYGGADVGSVVTTSSGLRFIEIDVGEGAKPNPGEIVSVHYTGWLEDGSQFDSSVERGLPIQFVLGAGQVIPGWDEGIALLNEGGKARLIIPPALAYGDQGSGGGLIPPAATLVFDVELVEIRAGAPASPTAVDEADYILTDSGLKYFDLESGEGPEPDVGQQVVVHFTGWLLDGTKFGSSLDQGQPIVFTLGDGQVIQGWDEGLETMKVGGTRQLVIPANLAYGDQGVSNVIPPNATLILEVELVDIR